MGMEVFLQKECNFPEAHKIGAAISGPRIAGKILYGHKDFSEIYICGSCMANLERARFASEIKCLHMHCILAKDGEARNNKRTFQPLGHVHSLMGFMP